MKLFSKLTIEKGFAYRKYYLTFINFIFGTIEQIEGEPINEPALYVSNHRGMIDFFINLKYLNTYILSKAEVEDIPIVGFVAQFTGIFYLERNSKDSRIAARNAIMKILNSGYNVLLYPEGTTNDAKTTKTFRLGAFEVAASNGFKVVPIALEFNSINDYWKDTSMMKQFIRQLGKPCTHVKMAFGPTLQNDDATFLMNESKNWIDQKLESMQSGWSKVY